MTTKLNAGDKVDKLLLELRLKTSIVAGDVAGMIVDVPLREVFVPTPLELAGIAQRAAQDFVTTHALRSMPTDDADALASDKDVARHLTTVAKAEAVKEFVALLTEDRDHPWRRECVIVTDYMPPYPRPETKPATVIQHGVWYLRYSCGPRNTYFWDVYGDNFLSVPLAVLAILQAPPVPKGKPYVEYTFPIPGKVTDTVSKEGGPA